MGSILGSIVKGVAAVSGLIAEHVDSDSSEPGDSDNYRTGNVEWYVDDGDVYAENISANRDAGLFFSETANASEGAVDTKYVFLPWSGTSGKKKITKTLGSFLDGVVTVASDTAGSSGSTPRRVSGTVRLLSVGVPMEIGNDSSLQGRIVYHADTTKYMVQLESKEALSEYKFSGSVRNSEGAILSFEANNTGGPSEKDRNGEIIDDNFPYTYSAGLPAGAQFANQIADYLMMTVEVTESVFLKITAKRGRELRNR